MDPGTIILVCNAITTVCCVFVILAMTGRR